MKIGIIGNMNNMNFSLGRFLADEGYDCDLLLFDNEPEHFHPVADSFDKKNGLGVRQLTWGDPAHFFTARSRVKRDVKRYSFLIGSGPAPAFLHSIDRVLDLFIPYGDDLYGLPFARLVHPVRQLAYLSMAWHQRRGIQNCPYILFDRTTSVFEAVFKKLEYKGERIVSPPPLFYHKEYEAVKHTKNSHPFFEVLQKLRGENDLLILQHIRQVWKSSGDKWSLKGNNYLFEGYAQFIKANPGIKVKLLLLDYGSNAAASRQLINDLGITDKVVWFPKTFRKHLMYFIEVCDMVVGELHHSWNSYCVMFETLAMSKPFMHKLNENEFTHHYPEQYPMFNASSAVTVRDGLQQASDNKLAAVEMGAKANEWYLTYCVNKPLRHIRSIIEEHQKKGYAKNPA